MSNTRYIRSILPILPVVLWLLPCASPQLYTISTVAGLGRLPFGGENAPAINAFFLSPRGVAAGSTGAVFISDQYYNQVFRVSAGGIVTTYAGNGQPGLSGDGGPAIAAQLNQPGLMALDSAGNLYICDIAAGRVRKVSPDGTISTFASLGATGVAVDSAGNVYISQSGANVVHVVRPNGSNSIIAGTGIAGFSGDGGQATAAQLFAPAGLRVDAAGNIYVADSGNHRVRKITPQGVISTVAGNGQFGYAGDNMSAVAARLWTPGDVALGANGVLYIADTQNFRIRAVSTAGIISTFAGGVTAGPIGTSPSDGPADRNTIQLPTALAVDAAGNLLVAASISRQVKRVSASGVTTIAGVLPTFSAGDNIAATAAPLFNPWGAVVGSNGSIFISDVIDQRIRQVSPSGTISTFAGNGLYGNSLDAGPASQIGGPRGLATDPAGNLYATVGSGQSVVKLSPAGLETNVAGSNTGTGGFAGDGGAARLALLQNPYGVAVDPAGNVYIADNGNQRIRRVDPSGAISTFAGTGEPAYGGDGGPATAAKLLNPRQIAVDKQGNVYFADLGNNRIRKITAAGTISTVAGTGVSGGLGDGGPATAAQVALGGGVAVDAAGNLYVATTAKIRKVDASTGIITTIAGTGTAGFSGDGGPATLAAMDLVNHLAIDSSGAIYFTDFNNFRVRKLTPVPIAPACVLHAATLQTGPVAPGEIVVVNVPGLGPASTVDKQVTPARTLSTTLAGYRILFDGAPAALLSVQSNQITAIVPYSVAGQSSTQMQVVINGANSNAVSIPVASSSPGIFTQDSSGQGTGVILNSDGSINSPSNPAARGSQVTISATGEGQTNPAGVDGLLASAAPPSPVADVAVQIGGVDAQVISAGGAPGLAAGFFQVVAQVPDGAATGDAVAIVLTVGGVASQTGVTVSVQ